MTGLQIVKNVFTVVAGTGGILAVATVLVLLLKMEPIGALPAPSDSTAFLGALLGAQAAIAALTLAVALFVMQIVSYRRDADDRVHAEYARRSWARWIFWLSIFAVAVTGAVLAAHHLIGDTGTIAQCFPGLPNLALIAFSAFIANLIFAVSVFERAAMLVHPERWLKLRTYVNKRDVGEGVRVFIGLMEHRATASATDEVDWSTVIPDPREGSSDQAVRALLDDARRAMDDRRLGELRHSMNSIKELVEYAMDEIENAGLLWNLPGASAEWPPLWELNKALYQYRETVIRSGDREYLGELFRLDNWLVSTGLRRSCGELFTSGLDGYRWNYEIAVRAGSRDVQGMVRDRFLMNFRFLPFRNEPERFLPFMREVVNHQGNMLFEALYADRVGDYQWLHDEFDDQLSIIRQRWNAAVPATAGEPRPSDTLLQDYRITLMGLAGRAVVLADSGEIPDPTPYLDVARGKYRSGRVLGVDIAAALEREDDLNFSERSSWESPYRSASRLSPVSRSQYLMTCFTVLLMDLAQGTSLTLDLSGKASLVLQWFEANSERLRHLVQETPSHSAQGRREVALEALQRAAAQHKGV